MKQVVAVVAAVAALVGVGGFVAGAASGQSSLPDAALTPGAVNPDVTQEMIGETICVRGWTRSVRPPEPYTYALKRRQVRDWGYANRRLGDYVEDHLVPLELGGAPYDERNLWPEPRVSADGWDAGRKDEVEFSLNRLVCSGQLSLSDAQRAIATNWIDAYRRFVSDVEWRNGR